MILREQLEHIEEKYLASYAMVSTKSRNRKYTEHPALFRTDYQRDRDRIIHSAAFRRMEYKTQVFVNHEGDHYRTRLTHTLEVAQIARTIARSLQLNEDLTEALVLSHDLGHTPFGHAGERMMAMLMKDYGGFEHNAQSLRVVDVLEKRYPMFQGLNLTFEVREGIIKHSANWKNMNIPEELAPKEQPTMEAQLIDLVDEIAYNNHDVDDGLSSHLIDYSLLQNVTLWRNSYEEIHKQYPLLNWKELKYRVISNMISTFVNDLLVQTTANIHKYHIKTVEDVRNIKKTVVEFSPLMEQQKKELKDFLWEHLYTNYRVIRMEEKAKRVIRDLFGTYTERPEQLPKRYYHRSQNEESKERVICDYIAGMTDRFALDEHKKLFDPHTRV